MNRELAETLHRYQFIADAKRAAALGLTEPEYRSMRRQSVQKFTEIIRGLMQEACTEDPVSVLPDFAASICEVAIAEARIAAKEAARREIQKRLARAGAP